MSYLPCIKENNHIKNRYLSLKIVHIWNKKKYSDDF